MNRFVLKNTFIKIYIYYFSINIFIKIEVKVMLWRPCHLTKTTSFANLERVVLNRVKCTRDPLTCEEVSVRSINFQSGFLGP